MNNLFGWCPRRIESFSLAKTSAPTGTSIFTMARPGASFEVVSLMSRPRLSSNVRLLRRRICHWSR